MDTLTDTDTIACAYCGCTRFDITRAIEMCDYAADAVCCGIDLDDEFTPW